jgi:transposase
MADENRARWTRLVADFESCDLSQREFAEERGLPLSNLRYWLYRLRKESRPLRTEEPEHETATPKPAPTTEGSRLLPVRVVASAPKARRAAPAVAAAKDEGLLELALPSGTRLRFPVGTDPHYLRSLAAAL